MSNVRDHARSKQHSNTMSLLKKEQAMSCGQGLLLYSTIAQSFIRMNEENKQRLSYKFDISV